MLGSTAGIYARQRFTASCAAKPKGCSACCVPGVMLPLRMGCFEDEVRGTGGGVLERGVF